MSTNIDQHDIKTNLQLKLCWSTLVEVFVRPKNLSKICQISTTLAN